MGLVRGYRWTGIWPTASSYLQATGVRRTQMIDGGLEVQVTRQHPSFRDDDDSQFYHTTDQSQVN